MKQFRAYDALAALKEIEQIVPFSPNEGWEFHDILYRNLAWCYSALDEAERCLDYTRKSVEVKRDCGIPASWFDIWDLGKGHARLGQKTEQRKEMVVAYDLCVKAAEIHETAEPSDRIMRAKILSNVGEVAMGIGDSYHLEGNEEDANLWYEKAEPSLRRSYELHVGAIGPLKPLSGWAAGTVAHCMVRLKRWEDARDYLTMAWKVECTKDSTTPGSVIELLERVMGVQQQLDDLPGMSRYVEDLKLGLQGLRARGWDRRERDVFSLLLQKASTALLLSDNGTGLMVHQALSILREAQNLLTIHLSESHDDLDAHNQRQDSGSGGSGNIDVEPKQFGPRADAGELLEQVRSSIRLLEITEKVVSDSPKARQEGEEEENDIDGEDGKIDIEPRFREEVFEDSIDSSREEPLASSPSDTAPSPGPCKVRRSTPPFCTQLRVKPTLSREDDVFLSNVLVQDGEDVRLECVDDSGIFGFVSCRHGNGWVQLKYLMSANPHAVAR